MGRISKKVEQNLNQGSLIYEKKLDYNPFYSSSLFSDVYLKNDLPKDKREIWDNDENSGFSRFYQGFIDLSVDKEKLNFEKMSEDETIDHWIIYVMELLGWENNSGRNQKSYMRNKSFSVVEDGKKHVYRPDLIYFDKPNHITYTDKENDAEKRLREVRDVKTGSKIIVEAKFWNRLAGISGKRGVENDDSASGLGAELQTLKYMEILNHDFGILTDGKTWKLFHKELSQGMDRRCYEFDLGNLKELAIDLSGGDNEQRFKNYAKYFYFFFSKESLIQDESSKGVPLVHQIFEYSKKYALSIEEDLKKRFIITMGTACNSLRNSCEKENIEVDLETIRNVAESHLFNILFTKSCEVRKVLPIQSVNYLKLSLHEVIESLSEMRFDPSKDWDEYLTEFRRGETFGGKKFDWNGFEIFNRFINLYEVINDGTDSRKDFGFEIVGFKESIFSSEEWKLAKKLKISNSDMIKIIFNLTFIESQYAGRKYQQIPYSYFSVRQLGSIYESLLEFKLLKADTNLHLADGAYKVINKIPKKENLQLAEQYFVSKGDLFFSPDNSERKISGSYYTPDFIVQYIVEETLKPVVANKTSKQILETKVCDPAMGSGHFLAGALDFLVKEYRNKWSEETNSDIDEPLNVTARKILDSCIFGVDLNPRAVKLAKMSMWLSTALSGKKLENLEDQLKTGDALIFNKKNNFKFDWKGDFASVFSQGGFDAIIGNPPYARVQTLNKGDLSTLELLKQTYPLSTNGSFDLSLIFFEKSLKLLNNQGRIGFITPRNFMNADFGAKMREKFTNENLVDHLVDFKNNLVFKDASTYTCITILDKSRISKGFEYVEADTIDLQLSPRKLFTLPRNQASLEASSAKWVLGMSSSGCDILKKLNRVGEPFSNFADKIFQGIATSLDKAYVLDYVKEDEVYFYAKSELNGKVYKLEKLITKSFFTGKDISRYSSSAAKKICLFPYDISNSKPKLFSQKELLKLAPNAWSYFKEFKTVLESRENGKVKGDSFYKYIYPKSLAEFEGVKLLMRDICLKGQVTIDLEKTYFTTTLYGIKLKSGTKDDLYYTMAFLNSELTWFFIKNTSSAMRGGYFRYKTKYLMPLPFYSYNKAKKEHKQVYESVVRLAKQRIGTKDPIKSKIIDDQIDELFYGLFNLTKSEISSLYNDDLKQLEAS